MMEEFLTSWGEAAMMTLGFFWMALWAFSLGYIISSIIQVFVTRQRMQQTMGTAGARSVTLGDVFRLYFQFLQFRSPEYYPGSVPERCQSDVCTGIPAGLDELGDRTGDFNFYFSKLAVCLG